MSKILVIVESPGKIKKIESILGNNYIVMASMGHIMDLPKKSLGIDIENNFKPSYEISKEKIDIVKKLRNAKKESTEVILATDKDREGEMIAWCLAHILNLKNAKRVSFGEITKIEIIKAMNSPILINDNLVNAQKTRRIMDRIIGFKISPLLDSGLSAGRVQSVVTKLIIDKENEIKDFFENKHTSYFKINANFLDNDDRIIIANLEKENTIYKIQNKENCKKIIGDFINKSYTIYNIQAKESIKNPSKPFTTSTLQQEASKRLRFPIKITMMLAQHLYEAGHITYMRTDSIELAQEVLDDAKKYIISKYSEKYHQMRKYKSKSKNTQEAHEAIRPTHIEFETIEEKDKIGPNEIKLYNLIWERTITSQMKEAIYSNIVIKIEIENNKQYIFQSKIENLIFEGFLIINKKQKKELILLPKINSKLVITEINGLEDCERPPLRYDEASLIHKLDPKNLNIGRPATYASLINTIQEREYVVTKNIIGEEKNLVSLFWDKGDSILEQEKKIKFGEEKNKFVPTEKGIKVTNFLIENFNQIMDYKFTSDMDKKLDQIANGKKIWSEFLSDFYKTIEPNIKKLSKLIIKKDSNNILIGIHPITNQQIVGFIGPHGHTLKMNNGEKYIFIQLENNILIKDITIDDALKLFKYPLIIGTFNNFDIIICKGKYGPYINYKDNDIKINKLELEFDECVKIIEDYFKQIIWQKKSQEILYTIKKIKSYIILYIKDNNKKKDKYKSIVLHDFLLEKITIERVTQAIKKYNKNIENEKNKSLKFTKIIEKNIINKKISPKLDKSIYDKYLF
jgi:DNA topoisomerase-1